MEGNTPVENSRYKLLLQIDLILVKRTHNYTELFGRALGREIRSSIVVVDCTQNYILDPGKRFDDLLGLIIGRDRSVFR